MKKITQFIFYGKHNREEEGFSCLPSSLDLWSTNLLSDYGPVSHLGIQGEPGVIFYLNYSDDPITLGVTGIYEIDLEGLGSISSLRFDMQKLSEKYDTSPSHSHRLLVDIIYEGVEM